MLLSNEVAHESASHNGWHIACAQEVTGLTVGTTISCHTPGHGGGGGLCKMPTGDWEWRITNTGLPGWFLLLSCSVSHLFLWGPLFVLPLLSCFTAAQWILATLLPAWVTWPPRFCLNDMYSCSGTSVVLFYQQKPKSFDKCFVVVRPSQGLWRGDRALRTLCKRWDPSPARRWGWLQVGSLTDSTLSQFPLAGSAPTCRNHTAHHPSPSPSAGEPIACGPREQRHQSSFSLFGVNSFMPPWWDFYVLEK